MQSNWQSRAPGERCHINLTEPKELCATVGYGELARSSAQAIIMTAEHGDQLQCPKALHAPERSPRSAASEEDGRGSDLSCGARL